MIKVGVMGWPISHSLSPRLHNYWMKEHHLAGEYAALEVKPLALGEMLCSLASQGYRGVNLTVPHKEAAQKLMNSLDPVASAIGAVNTVLVEAGKLKGYNTDAYGFIENLRQAQAIGKKNKAVVLGAGGAARAVCKALLDEGFERIVIVNRTPLNAQAIARKFGEKFDVAPWEQRNESLADADLLVNSTSLGLKNGEPLEIDLSALPKEAAVNDLVYAPLQTPLLKQAAERGNKTVDGLGMLIHQAAAAFEIWFGVHPSTGGLVRKYLLEPV